MKASLMVLVAIAALSEIACSSGSDGTSSSVLIPGAFAVGPTPAEFCAALAKTSDPWCAYRDRCCSAADRSDPAFADVLCVSADPGTCTTAIEDALAKNRDVYHPEHAQACIDAVHAMLPPPPAECSGMRGTQIVTSLRHLRGLEQIAECRATLAGTIASGQPCEYNLDCAEPMRCRNVAPPNAPYDFRCAPVVATGQACGLDGDCADDELCAGPFDSRVCSQLRDAGGGCRRDDDCVAGLTCDLVSKTCVRPGAAGEPSGMNETCEPLAYCDSSTRTCIALKKDGEACSFYAECMGRCDSSTHVCVPMCGGTR
jgi:hypothetical protein